MEFSRQEYWSRQPFPSPGDLPDPGIKSGYPALQGGTVELAGEAHISVGFIPCDDHSQGTEYLVTTKSSLGKLTPNSRKHWSAFSHYRLDLPFLKLHIDGIILCVLFVLQVSGQHYVFEIRSCCEYQFDSFSYSGILFYK